MTDGYLPVPLSASLLSAMEHSEGDNAEVGLVVVNFFRLLILLERSEVVSFDGISLPLAIV